MGEESSTLAASLLPAAGSPFGECPCAILTIELVSCIKLAISVEVGFKVRNMVDFGNASFSTQSAVSSQILREKFQRATESILITLLSVTPARRATDSCVSVHHQCLLSKFVFHCKMDVCSEHVKSFNCVSQSVHESVPDIPVSLSCTAC